MELCLEGQFSAPRSAGELFNQVCCGHLGKSGRQVLDDPDTGSGERTALLVSAFRLWKRQVIGSLVMRDERMARCFLRLIDVESDALHWSDIARLLRIEEE